MGIMDKVKAQAEQAMVKAQQGVTQGQAKLEAYQANKHSRDALLRELGSAYYDMVRSEGSQAAVDAALAAVDQAAAEQAAADQAATGQGSAAPAAPAAPTAAMPDAPAGGFNLDDV